MKTDSDFELETLASMWKQIKQRIESRQDDSRQLNDTSRQILPPAHTPFATKNYAMQIQALQDELFAKNNKLIQSQSDIYQLSDENASLQELVEKLTLENEQYKFKLEQLEIEHNEAKLDKNSIKLIKLENDSLRQDVKRLLELLKTTKEYKTIGVDETQLYIKGVKKVNFDQTKVKINSNEEISWVPKRAIELLNEVQLNEQAKDEILLQLNKIFVDHYEGKVQKYKQKTQNEMATMKRQLQSRVSYDGVIANKTAARLKKLSNSQQRTSNNTSTMQIQECFNLLKDREDQIKILRCQIQQLEDELNSNDKLCELKKQIFLEGAHWMLAKILDEVVFYEISINDLNQNLSQRIDELIDKDDIVQQKIINKVYKWITETSKELIEAFKDKLQLITQQTYSRMQSLGNE